jgi:hypothetical protein
MLEDTGNGIGAQPLNDSGTAVTTSVPNYVDNRPFPLKQIRKAVITEVTTLTKVAEARTSCRTTLLP